jgi:hypothetical protein
MKRLCVLLLASLALPASPSMAGEAEFLAAFAGSWSGKGKFRMTTRSSPVTVSCAFEANASQTTLSLDGRCRGMVVISRRIGVMLEATETGFSGSYVGSTTGPAGLAGVRSENAFRLSIRWAKTVNGDRQAEMRVEKTGDNQMRIITLDGDPASGESVVTSEIALDRS